MSSHMIMSPQTARRCACRQEAHLRIVRVCERASARLLVLVSASANASGHVNLVAVLNFAEPCSLSQVFATSHHLDRFTCLSSLFLGQHAQFGAICRFYGRTENKCSQAGRTRDADPPIPCPPSALRPCTLIPTLTPLLSAARKGPRQSEAGI